MPHRTIFCLPSGVSVFRKRLTGCIRRVYPYGNQGTEDTEMLTNNDRAQYDCAHRWRTIYLSGGTAFLRRCLKCEAQAKANECHQWQ